MRQWRLPLVVAASLLATPVAQASEEAHQHAAGIPWGALLFSTVNLAIFIGILARYALPFVRDWVRKRRDRVVDALQAAATAKSEAEKLRAEWSARLADIGTTIETMRAQARADAERERDRILQAARKTAEAIRRDAERAAAYEIRRTQEQLRAELVRQALHLAEETARTTWSAADQQRFIDEFLKQVQP